MNSQMGMVDVHRINWKNTIILRILLAFLLALIPLYLLGYLAYVAARQTIEREIAQSMAAQVDVYLRGLEEETHRINILLYDLAYDVQLNRLAAIPASLTRYQMLQNMLDLQNRLQAIRYSSRYIKGFCVYIPAVERIVTDREVDEFSKDEFTQMCRLNQPRRLLSCDAEQRRWMLLQSPYEDSATGEPMFLFAVELDPAAFAQALGQYAGKADNAVFLADTQNGNMLASARLTQPMERAVLGKLDAVQRVLKFADVRGKRDICVLSHSESLGLTLGLITGQDQSFAQLRPFRGWFALFTGAALLVVAFFTASIYRFLHKPLARIINAFGRVEQGELRMQIPHDYSDEFSFLYARFNSMAATLDQLVQQTYTMQILTQKAQLKQLQAQINPHFLYNSFFVLHRRVKSRDFDSVLAMSQQLGSYFRFIARNTQEETPLHLEVEHARIYADIQRIRFSSRIQVEFEELPEPWRHVPVPRLILQPVLENAFEHGLENKVSGGLLEIRFAQLGESLCISVQDNGEELTDSALEALRAQLSDDGSDIEITGLINIHRRLRLRFGAQCGLCAERSALGGLCLTLQIAKGADASV